MNRSWLAILFTVALVLAAGGCNTAAPTPYYSSRRDLLGEPAPATPTKNSINQRLSGSPPTPSNQDAVPSTNSPPRQTQ